MAARVGTVAFEGVEARRVDVEVQMVGNDGRIVFAIVGLPDKAESREPRAVSGCEGRPPASAWPCRHGGSSPNLAPADLPKESSHFDLPIAPSDRIAASGQAPCAKGGGHANSHDSHLSGRAPAARA